ncbi:MAG: GNAT family N-acetyltransferase [Fimbriimonadaceae bacterium]|nr:GNAT family N-acetyltransferase [Fimbriimonadaceae bacterium]QYK56966.1 MAG: GNAT family N-acetyltransferase [Fimbriimonadaceae bacterium]
MVYGRNWRERFRLPDGTEALFRLVRPTDAPWFQDGFRYFSRDTMYRRLMSHRDRFTEAELRYLTSVDGWNHLCIVAFRRTGDRWEALAAGSFIRRDSDGQVAEFAVLVGDPVQRMGVGTRLALHLVRAARERGIKRFCADMLADNVAVFALIDKIAPAASWLTNGIVAVVEFDLRNVKFE